MTTISLNKIKSNTKIDTHVPIDNINTNKGYFDSILVTLDIKNPIPLRPIPIKEKMFDNFEHRGDLFKELVSKM